MVEFLRPCIESLLEKTTYSPFEIIVIDNASQDAGALEYLSELEEGCKFASSATNRNLTTVG